MTDNGLRTPDVVAMSGLACVAFLSTFAVRNAMPDDAFIYLRYARNLGEGAGWVFNRDEPILAATSPLYTALLALLHIVGIPGRSSILLVFAAGLALTAAAIFRALRPDGRVLALASALAATTWPPLLRSVGMESSILLATVALAGLAYQRGHLRLAGALAGSCALARPEGVAMLGVLLVASASERDRKFWPLVWPFCAVVGPWLIFSWIHFGSVIPHTLQVKAVQASIAWWAWDGPWIASFARQIPVKALMIVLMALGARRAVLNAGSGRPFAAIVSLFGVAQVAGYSLLGAPPRYWWYYAPGNFAVVILATCGLQELALAARMRVWPGVKRYFQGAGDSTPSATTSSNPLTLLALCIYLSVAAGAVRSIAGKPYNLAHEYTRAAQWLAASGSKDDWVACAEIGYIGYYSGLRVRDMLGLLDTTSPERLRKRQWDWWFRDFPPPRFVVTHSRRWIGEPQASDYAWPEASLARFSELYERRHIEGTVEVFEMR